MESGAILIYLADKAGQLLPREGEPRYRVLEWLMWQMGGLGPMLGQTHHFLRFNKGKAPYAEERFARRRTACMESRIAACADHAFVAGAYSIADIAIWPWVSRFEWQTVDLGTVPEREALVRNDCTASSRSEGLRRAQADG